MEPEKISIEIKKLGLLQKLILAQDIWDSIALERGNLPMPEWQKSELERRYIQYKQGKMELHNWHEVHDELRRTYESNGSLSRFSFADRLSEENDL